MRLSCTIQSGPGACDTACEGPSDGLPAGCALLSGGAGGASDTEDAARKLVCTAAGPAAVGGTALMVPTAIRSAILPEWGARSHAHHTRISVI